MHRLGLIAFLEEHLLSASLVFGLLSAVTLHAHCIYTSCAFIVHVAADE